MEATVDRLGTELKGVFEILYTAPRFMVQGEYFLNRLNRTEGRLTVRREDMCRQAFWFGEEGLRMTTCTVFPAGRAVNRR